MGGEGEGGEKERGGEARGGQGQGEVNPSPENPRSATAYDPFHVLGNDVSSEIFNRQDLQKVYPQVIRSCLSHHVQNFAVWRSRTLHFTYVRRRGCLTH
jgi:hypothetical protein